MVKRIQYIIFLLTLLLLGGLTNEAWAEYKVTYHILTLPLDHTKGTKNTIESLDGKRVAAIKAIDAIGTEVGLDEHLEHFKSPLAKNFSYFDASIVKFDGAQQMYVNHTTKYPLYVLNLGNGPISPYIQVTVSDHAVSGTISECTKSAWEASGTKQTATTKTAFDTTVSGLADGTYYFKICLDEESAITANCDIFVTYEYNPDNGIAKLDGSESYNIEISGGFVAYNKGRNNRMAVIPAKYSDGTERITGEQLSSKQFVQADVTGTSISPWWNGNLTPKDRIYSYYHFLFKYEGEDPYNITIRSAYEDEDKVNPDYYIELYGSSDTYSVNKLYEGSSIFAYRKSTDQSDELLLASDDNVKYTTANDKTDHTHTIGYTEKPGFYRNLGGAIWNSFAMLNNSTNTGYVFMGTKCVKSDGTFEIPSDSKKENGYYKYYYLNINDQNKLYYTLQTATTASNKSSSEPEMYEIHKYLFKVKTPFGNVVEAEKDWSEAYGDQNLTDHIPDALKRKYTTFTGAYREEGLSTSLTTFADADANATRDGEKRVIWLKYTTSMPFKTLPADGSYEDVSVGDEESTPHWYTIRMNGSTEQQYLGYYSNGSFFTGLGSNSDLHQGENSAEAQFAFMGDPFELKILSRAACEADGENRFVGCASEADANSKPTLTAQAGSSDISSWQIDPGSIATPDYMILRQYNTEGKYIGWNDGIANKPMCYSTTSSSIRVIELEKKDYVYHIVRSDGSIAVKATKSQDVGVPLKYLNIPDIIRSPGIANATLSYYWTEANATATPSPINPKTHASYSPATEGYDIYVRYDFGGAAPLGGAINGEDYYVVLNGENIYYDSGTIKSVPPQSLPESDNDAYKWRLGGNDPYAMTILNIGASLNFVNVDSWAAGAISWSTEVPSSKFIVKLSPYTTAQKNVYEVMAATGDDVDASSTYYNIARIDANTIQMVSNSTSAHGSATLRFELTPTDASTHNVRYHLIDKSGIDLLQVVTRQAETDNPEFPTEYRSPLVADYHYYVLSDFTTNVVNEKTIYSLNNNSEELSTIGVVTDVYVTYTTDTSYDLLNKKTMYLLRFAQGTPFKAEDGSDGLEEDPVTPVYPYCNGDCNFFVYGQDQFDLQQQGAASTRTRWAWFLESANNDPYHVKICSRQTETYNEDDIRAYFATYQPSDYDEIVTGLVWPNISGIQGTEYMILGSSTLYRLETTNPVALDANHDGTPESTQRYTVKSFEQYWKTYDTVRRKILKQGDKAYPANPDEPATVPNTPYVVGDEDYDSNRNYLTGKMGFHNYRKWAYAKRWNGYNISGKTSKGWEEIEHWFQTVEMGEGYFNLVPIDINPVLILLDQHGWEIMRKPLPTSPDDDTKEAKYDEIRPYDSPMVEKYYFWTKASKRSGFHQYYNLSQQVMVDGQPFTSTSLTELPPYYTATNLHDAKGNHLDEYVTYTVKDEYTQTYNATTGDGQPFLIQQGSNYASYDGSTLTTTAVPLLGGMSQYIIDNISGLNIDGAKKTDLWYVKPNARIDYEMGYVDASETTILNHDWTNAYTGSFSNGFDPYNIQISSVPHNTNYFVTNATGATLEEGAGSLIGTYGSDPAVAIGTPENDIPCSWYDSRALAITNATFMAVKDAAGNMQLMPRFDHTKRVKDFATLTSPSDPAINHTYTQLFRPLVYNYHILDNEGRESLRYRSGGDIVPQMPDHFKSPLAKDFKYYSDNMAYSTVASTEAEWTDATGVHQKTATSDADLKTQVEALTASDTYYFKVEYYKKVDVTTAYNGEKDAVFEITESNSTNWTGADSDHRKYAESDADMNTQAKKLTDTATDYYFRVTYYRKVTFNAPTTSTSDGIYSDVANKADISNREITGSLAGAGLTDATNNVYVRYSYNDEADALGVLEGKWFTMTLNNLDAVYSSGIKQASDSKPTPVNGTTAANKSWQWKFLKTPQDTPDPYAVQLFNRNNPGTDNEIPTGKRFALLSHVANGSYALAEAGTVNENYNTYNFLNGSGTMSTSTAATINQENDFLSTSCNFSGTNSQIMLTDEVTHEFAYKVYTNGGVFAISATQENETLENNNYEPQLPETIMSPLLNSDQFRYYNKDNFTFTDGNITATDTIGKALTYVYGLYDDEIIVHYTPYNPRVTGYKVPNERNATDAGQVERANSSNDASIGITNELLYNIIWHRDNMMTGTSENTITDGGNQELGADPSGQVWYLAGEDPYAIKLRTHVSSADRYLHKNGETSCNLTTTADDATTFMLLPREDNYDYGMLQITGGTGKLTGYGNTLTTDTPNKFIIFALSTHKVTYHLVISNIGSHVDVYYPDYQHTIQIDGTTQRNLTINPIAAHAVGHVSLGDPLKVPIEMKRPNVDYFFYVGDIYNVDAGGNDAGENTTLTQKYKGHQVPAMVEDPDLVGKHVHIYIVYTFQGGLATNAGEGFVTDVTQNKWYTFEAKKNDGTPLLAQFTNAWGMEVKEGRGTHYTNDYLWTPIGDPYGFKMYHRYTYLNSGGDNKGEPHRVMTTSTPDPFTNGKPVTMGYDNDVSDVNSIYELLADDANNAYDGTPSGYFKIHPVANSAGTQYYFKIIHGHENPADESTPEHDYVRLSSDEDYTPFTFGLSEELVKPYYDRAGYVGGLTTEAKALYKAVDDNTSYSVAQKLMRKQDIVYDLDNIVKYQPGYYRLHSPSDIAGITTRYASGYTHKTELDYDNNASADADGDGNNVDAIPMHFYERKGVNTTFEILANGFTRSAATQGAISITAPEYDPASIFYFYEGNSETPMSRVQTQGLYVKGAKGQVTINPAATPTVDPSDPNIEGTNERAAAIMTTNAAEATPLYIMDIGGAILLIHDNVTGERRGYLKYLSFDQNDADHIYDLKLTHNTHTDHAKWLMEPVNAQGITLNVHSGGDAGEYGITYYYSTWYAPFDVLLPNDNGSKVYKAYLCDNGHSPWAPPADLHPQLMSVYNTADNYCPEAYRGSYKFIPANTPALIATTDNAGVVKMTVPTSSPSTVTIPNGNTFTGVFLEQKLDPADPVRDVFVFGLPFTSTLTKDGNYASTGNISGTLPQQAETGAGFYINANPNKELGLSKAEWIRNNLYVLANRIYYRAPSGSGARENTRGIEFVPVIFDDDEVGEGQDGVNELRVGDGCAYDLLGRCVATAKQVKDGSWIKSAAPGIYIVNGKKVFVGKANDISY